MCVSGMSVRTVPPSCVSCRHAPRHTWREKVEPPSQLLKMHEGAASQEATVRGDKERRSSSSYTRTSLVSVY